MKRKVNYHMHSGWSADGRMSVLDALTASVELGFSEIAITDHVDFCTPYPDDVVSDIAACHAEIDRFKPKFPQLFIRKGVEIGLHRDNLVESQQLLNTLSPDFVIASVHSFRCCGAWNRESSQCIPMADLAKAYFEEVLHVAREFESWSVLGHLDFPMRYHPITEDDVRACEGIIDEILAVTIGLGRGLEINLGGVGKIGRPHPAVWILRRFFELGGTVLTLGTDAHAVDEITRGWIDGEKLLYELGDPPLYSFENMIPKIVRECSTK